MKFIDLEAQYRQIKEPLDAALAELFVRQDFILGKDVDILEARLAEYVGVRHCITCSNGTDALSMPLMLLKYGEGDAVFVPSFTFFSTAEGVAQRGAVPVLVDCDPDTFNMDPVKLEEAVCRVLDEGRLTPRMVIPVDLFGLCADYESICSIARRYGLLVMEDGAQGFGAVYRGKPACSWGDAATTSFFPAKPLGCYGDGGAIFTNNDEWAQQLRSIRVHGKGKNKYENNRLGLNARLDTMQAAVLNCKLDIFPRELKARNQAAEWYNELLTDLVQKPRIPADCTSVWAQYTLLLPEGIDRAALMAGLKEAGIPTMVYYERPLHLQRALAGLGYQKGDFPVSEFCADHALSLPMHPYLSREDCRFVAEQLNRLLEDML
mgnify:CR=1 FL=1